MRIPSCCRALEIVFYTPVGCFSVSHEMRIMLEGIDEVLMALWQCFLISLERSLCLADDGMCGTCTLTNHPLDYLGTFAYQSLEESHFHGDEY